MSIQLLIPSSLAFLLITFIGAYAQDGKTLGARDGDPVEAQGSAPNRKAKSKIVSKSTGVRAPIVTVENAVSKTKDCSGKFGVATKAGSHFWRGPNDSAKVSLKISNVRLSRGPYIKPSIFTLRSNRVQSIIIEGDRGFNRIKSCLPLSFSVDPVVTWNNTVNGIKTTITNTHMSGKIKVPAPFILMSGSYGNAGEPTTSKGLVRGRNLIARCCQAGNYSLQLLPGENMKYIHFSQLISDSTVINCNTKRPQVPRIAGQLTDLAKDGSFRVVVRRGNSTSATTTACTLNVKVLKPK